MEYKSIFRVVVRATEWAFERIRDAFENVAKDEAGRFERRTRNSVEEYRFPAAYHRASRTTRRCHDVVSLLQLQQVSLGRLRQVGFSGEEALQRSWWFAICEKHMIRERPTGWRWYKQVTVPVRPRCSKRMRYRKVCVKTWSMRSSCWQTSRKMAIAQSRVL